MPLLVVALLGSGTAGAAVHFVRAGANGANTGADWDNAWKALPSSLVRGDTYYLAGGSYPGRTFDTPASGTSRITIKGATRADHGTDLGWSDTYSVESRQAIWTSGVSFMSSHWVFDGSTGPVWSRVASEYGFAIAPVQNAVTVFNEATAIKDVTISHVTSTAPAGDSGKTFLATSNGTKSVDNVTFSHCYVDGWTNAMWATSAALPMRNWIVEYNVILNGFSSPASHGEDINNNYGYLDNLIIRHNWFEGRTTGTGCIVVLNAPAGPYEIYGNVFKKMRGGDGIITGVHYPLTGKIYNNTFIDVDNGYGNGLWIGHDVGATVEDNLIYDSIAGIGGNFTGTHDYNAYFNTTRTPSEAHGEVGTGSPFVNEPANDLRLSAATRPGAVLPSPYATDAHGTARGSDGTWDRGALEFGGSATVRSVSPPRNLRLR